MRLRYDRLAANRPVVVADDLSRMRLTIGNVNPETRHAATIRVDGLPAGTCSVQLDGNTIATIEGGTSDEMVCLPLTDPTHRMVLLQQE